LIPVKNRSYDADAAAEELRAWAPRKTLRDARAGALTAEQGVELAKNLPDATKSGLLRLALSRGANSDGKAAALRLLRAVQRVLRTDNDVEFGVLTFAAQGPRAELPWPAFVSSSMLPRGAPGSAGPSTRSGSGGRTPPTGGSATALAASAQRDCAALRRELSQVRRDKKEAEDALAEARAEVQELEDQLVEVRGGSLDAPAGVDHPPATALIPGPCSRHRSRRGRRPSSRGGSRALRRSWRRRWTR